MRFSAHQFAYMLQPGEMLSRLGMEACAGATACITYWKSATAQELLIHIYLVHAFMDAAEVRRVVCCGIRTEATGLDGNMGVAQD